MNITRRRGAIATCITLGVLTVGLAVTLNIGWILLNKRTLALAILGIILFARNIQDPVQLAGLIGQITTTLPHALLMVDQEGGRVARCDLVAAGPSPR